MINIKSIFLVLASTVFLFGCGEDQSMSNTKIESGGERIALTPLENLNRVINSSPNFENQGTWSAGYIKARASNGSVVVGPGSDNSNVFAQQFSVNEGDQFNVIGKASSVKSSKGLARIQINWMSPDAKFVDLSAQNFEVGTQSESFELRVIAPKGSASGTIYVVPGPDSTISYTEMKVMGK
jgi:hypothetical protein